MAKRPTRLRFTEDDLSSDAVKKAAGKAEKAAAKAEKAVDKITPKKHRKLRQEADVSASRTAKLRFGKAKADDIPPKPSGIKRTVTHAPVDTLSANVHKSISRYEDDNVGVQTAHQTELGAETAYHIADHAVYSHKLKAYDKAEKLVSKSDKANVNALFEKFKKDNPNASSNPLSRWRQKHNIKKEYAAARAGKGGKATAKGAGKTAKGVKSLTQKIADFCVSKQIIGSSTFTALAESLKLPERRTMGAKLERLGAELAKARKKKAEWDSRVKDLERRYREEENSEIHEMVHAANLTPDQLSELLKMFAEDSAPKPETIQSVTEEETTHEN